MNLTGNGTIDLAGSVSDLTGAVNVNDSSTAPVGVLVSGTNQVVGHISGTGKLTVNAGSDLTATHIVQSALVIGGTSMSIASVTIALSDSSGNPLTSRAETSGASTSAPGNPSGKYLAFNCAYGNGQNVPAIGVKKGIPLSFIRHSAVTNLHGDTSRASR